MEKKPSGMIKKKKPTNKKQLVAISLISGALVCLVLGTSFTLANSDKNDQPRKNKVEYSYSLPTQNTSNKQEEKLENGYYEIGKPKFNGSYYQYGEEDLIKMGRNSLKRVGKMFQTVDGIGPMGQDGEFFPDYFNEYFLASIAFNESSGRTVDKNGKPITSPAGAMGLMQIKPEAIEYANYYAGQFMEIDNIHYTVEDLKDPQTSMDIATILLIANCKNFAQKHDEIFKNLNEPFSAERQREIILAYYNNGEGNMNAYMQQGIVKEYLKEGSKQNYANKIISKQKEMEKKNKSNEGFYNFEIERN